MCAHMHVCVSEMHTWCVCEGACSRPVLAQPHQRCLLGASAISGRCGKCGVLEAVTIACVSFGIGSGCTFLWIYCFVLIQCSVFFFSLCEVSVSNQTLSAPSTSTNIACMKESRNWPEPALRLKEQFDILGIVFNCFLAARQMRLIPPL